MNSSFYLTHLDIYDALISEKRKITMNELLAMARRKGIFLSKNESRENIAKYISLLPLSLEDIGHIFSLTETEFKKEKVTEILVKTEFNQEEIQLALTDFKESRKDHDEVYNVNSNKNNDNVFVNAIITEIDHSLSRITQKRKRVADIEMIPTDEGLSIQYPADSKIENIVLAIVAALEKTKNQEAEVEKIELPLSLSLEVKIKFFLDLIMTIEGMTLKDVVGVSIYRPITDESDEELIDEDGDDFENEPTENPLVTGFIRSIAIEGSDILSQKSYRDFIETNDFYITRIRWLSTDNDAKPSTIIEFEASFANAKECKDFNYGIRSVMRLTVSKNRSTYVSKRPIVSDKILYHKKLKLASRDAYRKAVNASGENTKN
jgi:hypothetical protein